jgi:hypothetical protein
MDEINFMTPAAAAASLRASMRTISKLVEAGDLVPVGAGTNGKFVRAEVVSLKLKREAVRKAAIAELLELGEDEDEFECLRRERDAETNAAGSGRPTSLRSLSDPT